MKIFLYSRGEHERTEFLIGYLRDVFPELMNDLIVVDDSLTDNVREWASEQTDFTYIYFEEKVNPGTAFNQIIEGLKIEDDILICDVCYLPLMNAFDRLMHTLNTESDVCAVGPMSNSFTNQQEGIWPDAESALDWSEMVQESDSEEMLYLKSGVILFSKDVMTGKPFSDDAYDIRIMVFEKCVREFMNHKRMYISKSSGFFDLRDGYKEYFWEITDNAGDILDKWFGIHYFNLHGNMALVDIIRECFNPDERINVLEIGCDCGGTLFELRKIIRNAELYGTDINASSLRFASEFVTTKVNNIEDHDLDFGIKFDLIIFGDVLEHLRDPLGALRYCKKLLNKSGKIAASIPNLMNISVMRLLLNGDFPYQESGLLDKTHIHMFTYNEIIKMFNEAGFSIEKISMTGSLSEKDEQFADELLKLGKAEKFMYQAFQYQVVAQCPE